MERQVIPLELCSSPASKVNNDLIPRLKLIAYKDYVRSGGEKEMKKWAATRWFKKKPLTPQ